MVCKEDMFTWFRQAPSYNRIDLMCSLLNMCVPFELRFLGTYIEEQGKHDFQELRGASIIANSMEKLTKELSTVKGLMDTCVRHRLTIYVSLLNARNYSCANWIYNTQLRTESVDMYLCSNNFNKDANLHEELLLLFTLALYHPAFTYEQRRYIEDIHSRLGDAEFSILPNHSVPPCPPGLGYIKPTLPMQPLPLAVPKPITEAPMPPPGIPLPPAHGAEFAPGMWPRTQFVNTTCPPPELTAFPPPDITAFPPPDLTAFPPPDITAFPPPVSPLVSAQSSPTTSRSVSPTRMYLVRPHPPPILPITHMERIPPPVVPVKEPVVTTQYNTDLKTVPIEEVPGDTTDHNPQQQWLDSRALGSKLSNGLMGDDPIPAPPVKNQMLYLSNEMQTLNMDGDRQCTSSSESSNSSECHSPPATPNETVITPLHGPGRGFIPEPVPPIHTASKIKNSGNVTGSGNVSGSLIPPGLPPPPISDMNTASVGSNPVLYTSTCTVPYTSHYPVPPPPPPSTFHNRSFIYTQSYRPQFTAYQQNGEIPYLFPPYLCMYSSAAIPPPKITCYNCGRFGHIGSECKDPSIEEITQKNGYQLEYTSPPPDAPPPSEKQ